MKKTLSHQFIALLLIPVLIILTLSSYIVIQIRQEQTEDLKRYCNSTLDNIKINISSMTISMKRTSTMFASMPETQSYLLNAPTNAHQLQRQEFASLIDMSRSHSPDMVDVILWDKHSPSSMIAYIPADMERYIVERFKNTNTELESYFEFYIQPVTHEPFLIYFSPVFVTTFSKDFGKHLGNIAIISKTDTLKKLVNSTTDMNLNITDGTTRRILYSNNIIPSSADSANSIIHKSTERVPNTNLSITGTIYNGQIPLFESPQSFLLKMLILFILLYILFTSLTVQRIIIRPIHTLNEEIEATDYSHHEIQLQTSLNNEIGSIASHVNSLLSKVSSLNQRNIASQAHLYEMELSKKQMQIYAYQSQINPHFLYNMLQCMRGISLMRGIPDVAQICTNMADLFRYSIKGHFLVALEDELNIIDKYLYMIRIRFQDRITYTLEIAENTRRLLIPKMILQPLVENAIFHGLDSVEDNGIIQIRTYCQENDLFISIQDNGIGFDKNILQELNTLLAQDTSSDTKNSFDDSKGIGILNIHNKIRLYEGNNYGLSIKSIPGNTIVTIHLNTSQKPSD